MSKHREGFNESYILKIIPKISQLESIPYSTDLCCQECDKFDYRKDKPKVVGWCECDTGYQLVFECPYCFNKFRYHPHDDKFNINDFIDRIMFYYLGEYALCSNGEELEDRWDEYENFYTIV